MLKLIFREFIIKCKSKNIENNDELYFKYGESGYFEVLIWTFMENVEK